MYKNDKQKTYNNLSLCDKNENLYLYLLFECVNHRTVYLMCIWMCMCAAAPLAQEGNDSCKTDAQLWKNNFLSADSK